MPSIQSFFYLSQLLQFAVVLGLLPGNRRIHALALSGQFGDLPLHGHRLRVELLQLRLQLGDLHVHGDRLVLAALRLARQPPGVALMQ